MKRLSRVLTALVLLVLAFRVAGDWIDYYDTVIDARYEESLERGSWRGEPSNINNASMKVLFEWGVVLFAIWFTAAMLVYLLLRRKSPIHSLPVLYLAVVAAAAYYGQIFTAASWGRIVFFVLGVLGGLIAIGTWQDPVRRHNGGVLVGSGLMIAGFVIAWLGIPGVWLTWFTFALGCIFLNDWVGC